MKTIDLEKDALCLPPRKRAAMASRLLESLTSETERRHSAAWSEEADARIAAYDAGKISAKTAEHVLAYRGKRAK